jgi:hypothetical protein
MGDDRDSTIYREGAEGIVIFRDTKKISSGGRGGWGGGGFTN